MVNQTDPYGPSVGRGRQNMMEQKIRSENSSRLGLHPQRSQNIIHLIATDVCDLDVKG